MGDFAASGQERRIEHEYLEQKRKIAQTSEQNSTTSPVITRSCGICADDLDTTHFPPDTSIPRRCRVHCNNICQACLTSSMAAAIANKLLDHIGCPACDRGWQRFYVECHADTKALSLYNQRRLIRLLETMPDFRACQSPTCHSCQLHEGGAAEPIVTCSDCGFKSCFVHRMPWHNGKTCTEYDNRHHDAREREARRAKKEFEDTFGEGTKPCPKCRSPIKKISGCDHMHCKSSKLLLLARSMLTVRAGTECLHDFCWECAADHNIIEREGNHMHNVGCWHWREPPRAARPVTRQRRRDSM